MCIIINLLEFPLGIHFSFHWNEHDVQSFDEWLDFGKWNEFPMNRNLQWIAKYQECTVCIWATPIEFIHILQSVIFLLCYALSLSIGILARTNKFY